MATNSSVRDKDGPNATETSLDKIKPAIGIQVGSKPLAGSSS
ncbi:hypothetical protein HanIR_Chr14g0705571 [Helianthus annuus]|nr:hypothetical protein HanIR_Chr14g0705571 [Helianthus annuus]